MAFKIPDIDETQAPLLDHLIELRGRLVRAVLALIVAFAVCLYFADEIFGFLVRPLTEAFPPGEGKLVYTKLYEAFFVEVKVALFAGFFISFPIIANQMWAFIAPGLYAKEKKAFLPFLFATPILFTAGAALAYYFVMPTAFKFFLKYEGIRGGLKQEALPAIGEYLSLVMNFILAFGVSFLLPVLLLLLNKAGIVSRSQLVSARRYIIVAVVALAAVITPPDVISQIMLAVPILFLFEGSLMLMWWGDRKAAKAKLKAEKLKAEKNASTELEPEPETEA